MTATLDSTLLRCAVCGGEEIRDWLKTDFGAIGRCVRCRQVLRADRPYRRSHVALHQSSNLHETPYARLGMQASEELSFYDSFLDLLPSASEGASVLDVGCGAGEFFALALGRDFDVVGLEPVPELRQALKRRYPDRRIEPFPIEEVPLERESFDGVAIWDVIEHLVDPAGGLQRAVDMLRPGGYVGIATINHACMMYSIYHLLLHTVPPVARRFGPMPYNPFHTYYFTTASLARLVENAGLRIVEHRGYEFPLSRLDVGPALKVGMRGLYLAQALLRTKGEQYLFAQKPW